MAEALKGITLEELFWTCACGTAMGLEINRGKGGWFDLDCRHCGLVGSVSIRTRGIKPACALLEAEAPEEGG